MKHLLPLAAALAVAFSSSLHARAQQNTAPNTEPVSDLSQFKTPAALILYIHGIDSRAAGSDAEFDANSHATRLATADFLKRFPGDPQAWEAKLIDARLVVDATGRGRKNQDVAKAETTLREIAAAP